MRGRVSIGGGRGFPATVLVVVGLAVSACSAGSTRPSSASADRSTSSAAISVPASLAPSAPVTTPPPAPTAATTATSVSPPTAVPSVTIAPPPIIGRTIVLNPGHNGANGANASTIDRLVPSGFGQSRACDTTGTNTNAGYTEHAFNWDVTQRVKALLEARGVTVVLTRPSDDGVGPCIDERARIGNQPAVAAVVSIHADGAPAGGHGFHICEDSRQPATAAVAGLSHSLTVAIHDSLVSGSGLTTSTYLGHNGYYPRSDLAGLNLATVPATFIELGNMRNAGDATLQSSPDGRQRMADSIAAGIITWLA
jgi:N-acetylmuramoyl-L-alanine amidase